MSNALITGDLLNFIAADIQAAFATEADAVFPTFFEDPMVPLGSGYSLGYAVVLLGSTTSEFGGKVGTVGRPQRFDEFLIEIRKPVPSVPSLKIALAKIADANAVVAQLQISPNFHDVAVMPLVTEFDWETRGDPKQWAYDFRMRFSVYSAADHH